MRDLYEAYMPILPKEEPNDSVVSITKDNEVRICLPTDGGGEATVTIGPDHAIKLSVLIVKHAQDAIKRSKRSKPSGRRSH